MLTIVDLVMSDNRAAVCPYLDSCQGVSIDVVSFNEASTITKNINATLVSIKNGIAPVIGIKRNLEKSQIHTRIIDFQLVFDSQDTLTW